MFVYCDFHGHSRKSNVFMYGNSTSEMKEKETEGNSFSVKDFLNERMLPFMISQLVSRLIDNCVYSVHIYIYSPQNQQTSYISISILITNSK